MGGPGPSHDPAPKGGDALGAKTVNDVVQRRRGGGPSRNDLRAAEYTDGVRMLEPPRGMAPLQMQSIEDVHTTHEYARNSAADIAAIGEREWQPLKGTTRDAIIGHSAATMAFHSEVTAFISGEGQHFISFLKKEAEGPGLGPQILSALQSIGTPLVAVDTPTAFAVVESILKEAAGVALGEVFNDNSHERASDAYKLLSAAIGGMSGPQVFSMALMGAEGAEELGRIAGGIEGLLGGEAGALTQLNGRLSRGSTARFDEQREAGGEMGEDRLADFSANADEIGLDADRIATSLMGKVEEYKARLAAFKAGATNALAAARKALARVKDAYLGFVAGNTRNVLSASVRMGTNNDGTFRLDGGSLAPNDLLSDAMRSYAESASIAALGTRGFGVRMEVWYAGYRPLIVTYGADGSASTDRINGRLDRVASRLYRKSRGGGHEIIEGIEDKLIGRLVPLLRSTPISSISGKTIDAL